MHFNCLEFTRASGGDAMDTTNSLPQRSFIDLPRGLFQMLACAGPYLYRDTILLQKVSLLFMLVDIPSFIAYFSSKDDLIMDLCLMSWTGLSSFETLFTLSSGVSS